MVDLRPAVHLASHERLRAAGAVRTATRIPESAAIGDGATQVAMVAVRKPIAGQSAGGSAARAAR
jgi:hypothetical protein